MTCSDSSFTIPEEEDTEDMCQAEREWGMEQKAEGRAEGRDEGKLQISKLINILFGENRLNDIKRVTEDKDYCDKLIKEFKLDV